MGACLTADSTGWYRRLMELFEFTASQQAAIDKLPALLMTAGHGIGTPPVRIEREAVLVPAELYDLLLKLLDEHGLADKIQDAINADYERQEDELRAIAVELGLDPDALGDRNNSPA